MCGKRRLALRFAGILSFGVAGLIAPHASPLSQHKLKPCKGYPGLVGACFTIHGRYSLYDGSPMGRIWIVGTRRILGVDEETNIDKDGGEWPWIPANLGSRLGPGIDVFGDYEVCPLTKERAGEMQIVCVESASHMVIKDWNKHSQR